MAITYVTKNSLYINITNLCTNKCDFCSHPSQKSSFPEELILDREPTLSEILSEVSSHNLGMFSEIVFTGLGEPTCRLYDMLETCKMIKEKTSTPIRVNTNGHASMILGEGTALAFRGLVDCVQISLNAADSYTYTSLCRPRFGEDTFAGVVKFAREVGKYVPKVVLTVLRGTLTEADVDRCAQIAQGLGAAFAVRDIFE